jgi:alkanesulfonate monooxygenase SsuD/methylene tetrahydromethanopterin reductase-like flavin-dependent oxidoreductase (luciferase family)
MNAGSSSAGQDFSARYADMNFVMLRQQDDESNAAQISRLKMLAADCGRSSLC